MIKNFQLVKCGENQFIYNSLNLEIQKNLIKKFTTIKKYKELMINKCIKIANDTDHVNEEYNIISDYKMNDRITSMKNNRSITIIFNPLNYEKLLLTTGSNQFVLIDLNNFTRDINIVIGYIFSYLCVILDPYYFIQGKIWINFRSISLAKFSFIKINQHSYHLYLYLNKLSIYLKYMYSLFQKYNYSMKKIKKDKEIQYLFELFKINTL